MPTAAADQRSDTAPASAIELDLDPQQEAALEREVAGVRDPQLRAALKGFRRRLLQGRRPM
jgi:hypothetical protein